MNITEPHEAFMRPAVKNSKVICGLILILFLGACASSYKVSPKALEYRDRLSEQQALEVFHKALLPKKNAMGVCNYEGFMIDEDERPRPTATGFEVRIYSRGEKTGTEMRFGVKYDIYQKIYSIKKFDLKDLTKMRVMPSVGKGLCKGPSKGDYAVLVHSAFATIAIFDIASEDFDLFLAAMMKLAPQAEMIEGFGI